MLDSNQDKLAVALKANEPKEVARLLSLPDDQRPSVFATDDNQMTPLHHAAMRGYTDLVGVLLSQPLARRCDINARDNLGRPPVFLAVLNGHADTVTCFFDRPEAEQPDINATDDSKSNILFPAATSEKNIGILRYLMNLKNKPNFHQRDLYGFTILHVAASKGNLSALRLILELPVESRPSINARSNSGYTPLYIAAEYSQVAILRYAYQHADEIKPDFKVLADDGASILHAAAKKCHPNTLRLLLNLPDELRPNVRAKTQHGSNVLHYVALCHITDNDTAEGIIYLLNSPNIPLELHLEHQPDNHHYPMTKASKYSHNLNKEIVDLFIEKYREASQKKDHVLVSLNEKAKVKSLCNR